MHDTDPKNSSPTYHPRAIAYVDGFNLYFGVLQGNPMRKWLNLRDFIQNLRPAENLVAVRYFTATVDPDAHISGRRDRQKRYIKALLSTPGLDVTMGKYQLREVTCRAVCRQKYRVPEEKKTDVGLAVRMLSDAMDGLVDRIVLVSADSDLEPAVAWIRTRYPSIKITVYLPLDPSSSQMRRNDAYRNMGVDAKPLPLTDIGRFQFPDIVNLGSGRFVERPKEWK